MAFITGVSKINEGYLEDWSAENLLRRQTVIFGRNGSGKSSIATALREASADPDSSGLRFTLEDGKSTEALSARELAQRLSFYVFDKEYIRRNLGPAFDGTGLSTALFVLGEPNVELEKGLAEIQQRQEHVDDLVTRARNLQIQRDKSLKTANEVIRERVRDLGGHKAPPQSDTAVKLMKAQKPVELTEARRDEHRTTLRREPNDIPVDIGLWESLELAPLEKMTGILECDIESQASKIFDHLSVSQINWVKQGVPLHESGDQCVFCDNPIDNDRFELLTSLVSAEEKILQDNIEALVSDLSELKTAATGLHSTLVDKFSSMPAIDTEIQKADDELQKLEDFIDESQELLRAKSNDPSCQQTGTDPLPVLEDLTHLKSLAETENQVRSGLRDNLTGEQSTARLILLADMRAELGQELDCLEGTKNFADKRHNWLVDQAAKLACAQEKLEATRSSEHDGQRLANDLTDSLRHYLGHPEISIDFRSETDKTAAGFALSRNGQPASGLSEGERGAIALFHFIASLEDMNHAERLDQTCMVIDDPVSSLDNESMYTAFNYLVRALYADQQRPRVSQFIVLTHSQEFFALWRDKLKLTSSKLVNAAPQDLDARALLRLRARLGESQSSSPTRRGSLEAIPTAFVEYRSEYYHLFEQVCSAIIDDEPFPDLALTNCARRLLEAFALWKVPNTNDFRASITALPCDPPLPVQRLESLIKFLHTGSHLREINIGLPGDIIQDHAQEFLLCLGAIRLADPDHFSRMLDAVYKNPKATSSSALVTKQTLINEKLDVLTPLSNPPV